ncbi:MAG: AAA family ATPase, partial [Acidimicrobiia bacterium]
MQTMVPIEVLALAEQGSAHGQMPGAALVVDVEGSTALSARLQPHGVAGAESLADLLSAVFTPMVDLVTANNGFVAEFAGDGIVALFLGDADDAVARAVSAGMAIMSTLEEINELDTPAGPVQLTVRSVVGAGSVECLIWSIDDDAPQQAAFTYRGSAVMEAKRGEQLAPGRTLAVGPEAQGHLPADTATQTLSEGFASLAIDADWAYPAPQSEQRPIDGNTSSMAFFPPSITEATHRGEFRDVVSVFVEFHALPDTSPHSYMARLLELIAAHRGYLCNVTSPDPDIPGVRALALWGAPTSREHDVGYAMRFLDDLRASPASGEVRAGATLSTVYAGFVGTHQHASYTGIGFGVNLAARMCASADWGEILVDARIRSHLEPPWELDDLGQRPYRGFDHPTGTHSLRYVPPVRQPDPFRGAFVGRAHELDQLEDALAPLWFSRSCGVIAVAGEAGIGKSRLVDQLKERLATREPTPVWLEARADEIRSQPFATLRDALAGYFG